MLQDPNCLFCKIISGQIAGQLVLQNDRLTAIRDINPGAPVHVLVLPNEHIGSVAQAEDRHEALLGALLLAAGEVARQEGIAEAGYRVVINTGSDGGQSVAHLHVHVLGGRQLQWPPG